MLRNLSQLAAYGAAALLLTSCSEGVAPRSLEVGDCVTEDSLAAETGLALQSGHLVIELKTPGTDKGTALKAFMLEPPFAGAIPVMLGDDLTDEDGFRAAAGLGGFGVLVGRPRQTAATFSLPDVNAVLAWLDAVEVSP